MGFFRNEFRRFVDDPTGLKSTARNWRNFGEKLTGKRTLGGRLRKPKGKSRRR